MEDRKLNESESLDLITAMLINARTNQRAKINCNIVLVWGYVIVLTSILVWILRKYQILPHTSLFFLLIPVICFPVSISMAAKDRTSIPTYIDQSINYITILVASVSITTSLTTFWINFPALAVSGILTSILVVIIGILIKYKPLVYFGILGIGIGHCLLFIPDMLSQILIFALTFIISIIIPGHLLKRSISKHV